VEHLCSQVVYTKHAQRNLLDVPVVRELAVSEPVKQLAAALLGKECFAVRGILFNKTPNANWKVVWHQDRTIAVRERKDVAHFGPWSVKAGVQHVQPPALVLAEMLAIRLHLDESHEGNGPLRVIPGSHKAGCLSAEEIATWRRRPSVTCIVPRGGAILMPSASSCVIFLLKARAASSNSSRVRRSSTAQRIGVARPGLTAWFVDLLQNPDYAR